MALQPIVCIGGANVDRKARMLHPVQYKTSNPVSVTKTCGGVARNVAENLGRLGSPVSLMTFVGDDADGHWLLKETERHQVDTDASLILPKETTGNYTAILNQNGDLELALADMAIYDSVNIGMIERKWPLLSTASYIYMDTNLPAEVLAYVINRCKNEQVPLCVNPVSSPKARKLPDYLNGIDLLLPNRDEAEILSGISIDNERDCVRASEMIIAKGVKQVVITLGEKGLFVCSEDGQRMYIPSREVSVVDVTGAGDSLNAGMIMGLTEGENLETACRLGMVAAELTVQTEQTVHPELSKTWLYGGLTK